jgi:hypothetical protein
MPLATHSPWCHLERPRHSPQKHRTTLSNTEKHLLCLIWKRRACIEHPCTMALTSQQRLSRRAFTGRKSACSAVRAPVRHLHGSIAVQLQQQQARRALQARAATEDKGEWCKGHPRLDPSQGLTPRSLQSQRLHWAAPALLPRSRRWRTTGCLSADQRTSPKVRLPCILWCVVTRCHPQQ